MSTAAAPSLGRSTVALVPRPGRLHDSDDREHHRHLDQHADHRRKGSAGLKPEEADCRGDRELEEIARSNECGGSRDAPCDAKAPAKPIGEARIEVDLDK